MSDVSTAASPAGTAPKGKPGSGSRSGSVNWRRFFQRWLLLGILLVMVGAFSIWQPNEFAQWSNFKSIINTQSTGLFIALGAIFVLIVGEFDLSLGATLGLCQYLPLWLVTKHGVGWEFAVVIALAVGALIGLINGLLVKGIGINSFIATIGMASVLEGVLSWVSEANTPIFSGAPTGFKNFAQTDVVFGLTLPVFYALGAAIIAWIVIERTVFGREMRATGSNRQAAILSGLRTNKAVYLGFVLGGLLAGAAGVLASARIGAADATSGPSYLLPAYAAVFLGAIAVKPGFENVWGTVIALFVVAVGVVGLQLAGAEAWVTDVFNGGVLLIAVSASMLSGRLRGGGGLKRLLGRRRGGDPVEDDSGPAPPPVSDAPPGP